MTYRQHIDHLGNPVAPGQQHWQQRLIRRAVLITGVLCIAALVWGR